MQIIMQHSKFMQLLINIIRYFFPKTLNLIIIFIMLKCEKKTNIINECLSAFFMYKSILKFISVRIYK